MKIKENRQSGMTYLELIVVLGIFATLLSISMYNNGKFQDKVTIKTLANDLALKIVEAQKNAIAGRLTTAAFNSKPAYGVYFNTSAAPTGNNRAFIYFADIDGDKLYANLDGSFCPTPGTSGNKCLEKINLNRANTISTLQYYYSAGAPTTLNDLTVTFTRPLSDANLTSTTAPTGTVLYAQVNLTSPSGLGAQIKIYPSGQVQIN